ncbi:MAG: hypothetical protein HYW24_02325 [Candidatus Aenigmarchaeota archaeon]|nr:hypothetical protein [Candidatus Aenigmarchaeota archaeon]
MEILAGFPPTKYCEILVMHTFTTEAFEIGTYLTNKTASGVTICPLTNTKNRQWITIRRNNPNEI